MVSLAEVSKELSALKAHVLAPKKKEVHVERRSYGFYFPQSEREYKPSKTGISLHQANEFITAVLGPVGSGKSTMCCMRILDLAMMMPPCKDGVRRSKWAMIRNTYPELKSTTLATFLDWFGNFGEHPSLNQNAPITFHTQFNDDDGKVELTVIFLALDRAEDTKKLMSLEVTGAFMNEARYIPEIVLNTLIERVGRYPSAGWLKHVYKPHILLDTNPPDTDYWWYRRFEVDKNQDETILRQPGGLIKTDAGYQVNPDAENLDNLLGGGDYYLRGLGRPEAEIRVQLMGQYGSYETGDRIFTSYRDEIHAKDELTFTQGLPVIIGWDFGLTPAAVFAQMTPRGQLQIIKEICAHDMFIERFANDVIKPFINTYLTSFEIQSVGDPAGNIRAETDGKAALGILESLGLPTQGASTNNITKRLNAVDTLLNKMIDGLPGFVVSREGCPTIRKGLQDKYCWKVIGGEKKPDKNEFSHPMDALQYICLLVNGESNKKEEIKYKPTFLPGGLC